MTKKRGRITGTERILHGLQEGLLQAAVLTTFELRPEIRGDGPSRYRGDERQLSEAASRVEPWNT